MSHGLTTDTPITRDELDARRDAPVHIIGAAGAEGVAVARLLEARGFTHIVLHDMRERAVLRRAFRTTHGAYSRVEQDEIWDSIADLVDAGCYGDDYLAGIEGDATATVVLGQGWYLVAENRARIVAAASGAGLVTSMTELYHALAPGPIAAITGTNGKSTTVALVEALLEIGEVAHETAGNERSSRQFLPRIDEVPAGTWSLLEISNRQLMQVQRSPNVAAITALTPDHLEEHEGGFAGYALTKARVFQFQEPGDIAIVNADSDMCVEAAGVSPGTLVQCGIGEHRAPSVTWEGDELVATDVPVFDGAPIAGRHVIAHADDLTVPGDHNRRNAAVAAAVALAMGCAPSAIAVGLRAFSGKSLRLEPIATIAGVEIWSDIKSTTPEATDAALAALAGRRVHLIMGGDDKGLSYAGLAARIASDAASVWVVPGSATDALVREVEAIGSGQLVHAVETLPEALDGALAGAGSGDVVIVSPAAAGFWTRQLDGKPSLKALVRARSRSADAQQHREETSSS